MISVKHLRRNFGPIVAVDDISFEVAKGEVLGFLGPNGAGKSTAMKMLVGFLSPDGGSATICGHDVVSEPVAVKRCIGYLAENAPAYPEMTVGSFLDFVCDARQIKGQDRKSALDRVVPS
ncbi:MAG: ABC transporter ATP-binding protein, partial [Planctomycetes bacterium]|nr:ABC transporter ATP-binding protein [Planctomycetota bacterium]